MPAPREHMRLPLSECWDFQLAGTVPPQGQGPGAGSAVGAQAPTDQRTVRSGPLMP